jgi:hypothetical protein
LQDGRRLQVVLYGLAVHLQCGAIVTHFACDTDDQGCII